MTRECSKCERVLPILEFHIMRHGRRHPWCRECKGKSKRERYAAKKAKDAATMVPCECGGQRSLLEDACVNCSRLDGEGAIGMLVSALRSLGGEATFAAIAGEMGVSDRNVFRAIAMAKEAGRVEQLIPWEDMVCLKPGGRGSKKPDDERDVKRARAVSAAQHGDPSKFVLVDRRKAG